MKQIKNLFLDELADMYDAEHRIVKALPKLAKAAACEKLKTAFLAHLEETKGHVTNIEQVFQSFGRKAKGKKCESTAGLLKEGGEIANENKGEPTINAALISAAQKVEHYEIASYGCLHEWAALLGNQEAAVLLLSILAQEKAANEKLTELARSGNNREALGGSDEKGAKHESTGKQAANSRRGARPARSTSKKGTLLAR
jgi:ferritin-like metal-binding protein YciE